MGAAGVTWPPLDKIKGSHPLRGKKKVMWNLKMVTDMASFPKIQSSRVRSSSFCLQQSDESEWHVKWDHSLIPLYCELKRNVTCIKFWIVLDQKAALIELHECWEILYRVRQILNILGSEGCLSRTLYECIVSLCVTLFKDELNKTGCIGDASSLCAEGLDLFPMICCWLLPCAPDAFMENH